MAHAAMSRDIQLEHDCRNLGGCKILMLESNYQSLQAVILLVNIIQHCNLQSIIFFFLIMDPD